MGIYIDWFYRDFLLSKPDTRNNRTERNPPTHHRRQKGQQEIKRKTGSIIKMGSRQVER